MCSDPNNEWFPQRTICYATAAAMVAGRLYNSRFEKRPWHDGTYEPMAEEFSAATPWHYLDGVSIWPALSDMTPDDDFLGQSAADEDDGNPDD